MKILLLIVVVLTALGGCLVAPVGPDYGYYDNRYDRYGYGYSYPYAYPGRPYNYGPYYRRGYYWRQAP